MTDSATFLTPVPMEGHGVYNRSSRVQAAGLSPAVPLLEQAAKSVPLPAGPDPILLVDYGSSEGHNSLGSLATAIGILRERLEPERAISVVHTDLPDNDFTALFRTLAAGLAGGSDDRRAAMFIDRLEAGLATRLAAAPERMLIPLGKMLLVKDGA